MNELHLFSGIGGGILGGILLGHTTVCAVEIEPYCRAVLLQRQRDGILPRFPIWDDVRTFDGTPWRGWVDVVCGGFPCTDISCAGAGAGIEGTESGLWKSMARIVGQILPRFVLVENSPLLVGRGLAVVLGDLAELGYDARWGLFSAAACGAPHIRERLFLLAYLKLPWMEERRRASNAQSLESIAGGIDCIDASRMFLQEAQVFADADNLRKLQPGRSLSNERRWPLHSDWWATEPRMGRVVHGIPDRAQRTRGLGNAQVPAVVKLAWETLIG